MLQPFMCLETLLLMLATTITWVFPLKGPFFLTMALIFQQRNPMGGSAMARMLQILLVSDSKWTPLVFQTFIQLVVYCGNFDKDNHIIELWILQNLILVLYNLLLLIISFSLFQKLSTFVSKDNTKWDFSVQFISWDCVCLTVSACFLSATCLSHKSFN